MGLSLWPVSDDIMSTCVTAITLPEGITDKQLRSRMREQYKVMISGSHGELSGKLVRIGHMGNTATETRVMVAIDALRKTLKDIEKGR